MTSEELKQIKEKLQKVERESSNCIDFFLKQYELLEEKNQCTLLTTIEKKQIILVSEMKNIIEMLKRFPFNKTIWCSLLFYPVEFHEEKILEYLAGELLHQPTEIMILALKSWIEECGIEFTEKSLQIIYELIEEIEKKCGEEQKELVIKIKELVKNVKSNESEPTYKMKFDPAPISIEGKSIIFPQWMESQGYTVNILNKEFLEYAEQLMICEYTFLRQLQPKDFYIYLFESTRKNSNIMIYLDWCKRISNWVAYAIIDQKNEMIREMAFKNFLQLAIKCLEIKNFNSFVSIINGLKHYALTRMTKTMSLRTPEEKILMEELISLQGKILYTTMSIDYGKPTVPCLHYFLYEMNKIYEMEYEIDETINEIEEIEKIEKMIDLTKSLQIGEYISLIKEYLNNDLSITINQKINEFFMKGLRHMKIDNSDLLKLSMDSEKVN